MRSAICLESSCRVQFVSGVLVVSRVVPHLDTKLPRTAELVMTRAAKAMQGER